YRSALRSHPPFRRATRLLVLRYPPRCESRYRRSDGSDTTAYYAYNFEEAVNAAVEMTRRNAMEAFEETAATRQTPSRLKALSDDELWQLYEVHVWRPREQQPDELDEAILAEIDRRAELTLPE